MWVHDAFGVAGKDYFSLVFKCSIFSYFARQHDLDLHQTGTDATSAPVCLYDPNRVVGQVDLCVAKEEVETRYVRFHIKFPVHFVTKHYVLSTCMHACLISDRNTI